MLLRSQQRELTELRGQIDAMQSSVMAQVEHVLTRHQEQERILQSLRFTFITVFCNLYLYLSTLLNIVLLFYIGHDPPLCRDSIALL